MGLWGRGAAIACVTAATKGEEHCEQHGELAHGDAPVGLWVPDEEPRSCQRTTNYQGRRTMAGVETVWRSGRAPPGRDLRGLALTTKGAPSRASGRPRSCSRSAA